MNKFDFPVYGIEYAEYCFLIVDTYGENASITKLLDSNLERLEEPFTAYCDKLNAVREFLVQNGFASEIELQDKIFLQKVEHRPRKAATPMLERWKMD